MANKPKPESITNKLLATAKGESLFIECEKSEISRIRGYAVSRLVKKANMLFNCTQYIGVPFGQNKDIVYFIKFTRKF